jgi:predicted Zn-dependent protease
MSKNFDRIALTLAVMPVGKAVAPAEIEASVNNGPYAAKYISFLRRLGFTVSVQKNGRNVVSYTIDAEPENAAEHRALKSAAPKAPKAKAAKAPKAAKQPKARLSKQTPAKKAKKPAREVLKERADKEADAILADIGLRTGGEYAGGTYSVDPDWDSMDGIDVANFLK